MLQWWELKLANFLEDHQAICKKCIPCISFDFLPTHMNSSYCSHLYLHLFQLTVFLNRKSWMDLLKEAVTSPVMTSRLHSVAHKKAFMIQSHLILQPCLPLITISHIPAIAIFLVFPKNSRYGSLCALALLHPPALFAMST